MIRFEQPELAQNVPKRLGMKRVFITGKDSSLKSAAAVHYLSSHGVRISYFATNNSVGRNCANKESKSAFNNIMFTTTITMMRQLNNATDYKILNKRFDPLCLLTLLGAQSIL